MQRRNVDLPDPEGPSRHNTSPRWTSRSMPLSTSWRPKDLRTPSDLTIGRLIALTRSSNSLLSNGHHPHAHALQWGEALLARGAAAVAALEVVLPDVQKARTHQVPDAHHDQQRD